jgi:hypothetical protein
MWDLVLTRPQLDYIPKYYFKGVKKIVKAVQKNTVNGWKDRWEKNFKANSEAYDFSSLNVKQLKYKHKGLPALLIGAGSSLVKNLEVIKTKPFIKYVSLHSLRYMMENGVRPDYVVSLDAHEKQAKFFEGVDTTDLVLLADIRTAPDVLSAWKGKVYFFNAENKINPYCSISTNIVSGGSVMGAAYNLAINLGAKKIIFCGMDFSNPFGEIHKVQYADGSTDEGTGVDAFITADISGRGIWTLVRMWLYKIWFENSALSMSGIEHINATEGGILGAYPEGNLSYIKQMKLAEVN